MRMTKEQKKIFKRIARLGGRARALAMSPEQRRAQAIKAITARWARVRAARAAQAQAEQVRS